MADAPPIFDKDLFGAPDVPKLDGTLAQRFGMPPFTVLNAREGNWQSRKDAWIRLGIRSELGRGANVLGFSQYSGNIDFYKQKRDLEKELGRDLDTQEAADILLKRGTIGRMDSGAGRDGNLLDMAHLARGRGDEAERVRREKAATPGGGGGPNSKYFKKKPPTGRAYNLAYDSGTRDNSEGWTTEDNYGSGTSIFDPVLCELLYNWFSPPGGQVIDPFAGGSVRGIVAACLGRKYWGCDLSAAQIAANIDQISLLPPNAPPPSWNVGDALDMVPGAPAADFLVACPPYFDLEVYSEDPRDLSTMGWEEFRSAYDEIIASAAARLRDNRFAAFVVGDIRDEDGSYRNFPSYTTACFKRAGMQLYNEMILITAVGSLSIRAERQFVMSRKLGRTHQTVLIYCKGDPRAATDAVTGMTTEARRAELTARADARANATKGWE